ATLFLSSFFIYVIRPPPWSTLFPTRRSSDLRWADDLGDEVPDASRALELLTWWEHELDACYEGKPSHAVFVALRETIIAKDIPRSEEHTSELQSRGHLVCRLLLEKKKRQR